MGVLTNYLLSISAGFLPDAVSQALLSGYGSQMDGVGADALFGLNESRLETATPDAYNAHARNSGLYRLRSESDGRLLARLRTRWSIWASCGAVDGMVARIQDLGYVNVRVITQLDLYLAGVTTAFGGLTGFFYIELAGFLSPGLWDDGQLWEGGQRWDLAEPYPGALAELIVTIRKWKPVGRTCRYLRCQVAGPDGTTYYVHLPVGEEWEFDAGGNLISPYYSQSYTTP